MIVQTSYHGLEQGLNLAKSAKRPVVIVCPHSSDEKTFFSYFTQIWVNREIQKQRLCFKSYLRIEQG